MAPTPPPAEPDHDWPIPRFSLKIDDLSHEGTILFFENLNAVNALTESVLASFTWLYTSETVPRSVESILLVLKDMDGVAYTFGSATHKEIHLSLRHIKNSKSTGVKHEIMGVLVHEVVHCYQHNAKDTCPGGLIEGIADYVRLKSGYVPPHWKRLPGREWDDGYEKTGYFLEWMEDRYGDGTIKELNLSLKDKEYHRAIFKDVTGRSLRKLWDLYRGSFDLSAA